MTSTANKTRSLIVLLGAAAIAGCATGQGREGEPWWDNQVTQVGQQQHHRYGRNDRRVEQRGPQGHYGQQRFDDRHRIIARDYYVREYHSSRHCPPGLARRQNGCMPNGHARQWRIGQPLHHNVVYYDVPAALVIQMGAPPRGHRYVRVAGDILLIAIGTALVVDALEDLIDRR